MRWDLILGAVSIAIGIPAIVALFVQGSHDLAFSAIFAGLVLLGAAWFVQANLNQPAISVDFQKFTITFEGDRTLAHAKKQYEFRVHRKDLTEWVHRNIAADGRLRSFAWNGTPIPATDVVSRCKDIEVTTRNPYPWPKGAKQHGTLSYTFENSFPAQVEYAQYISDMPTKLAVLRVEFPATLPCTHAYLRRRANGVYETLSDSVDRDPHGRWLQVEISKPKGGHEYTVFWHW